jgi:hypothetical protein
VFGDVAPGLDRLDGDVTVLFFPEGRIAVFVVEVDVLRFEDL